MKFKYSAFIENTPEMREWLEKLGYKPSVEIDAIECSLPYLVTSPGNNDSVYMACSLNEGLIWDDDIDCLGNPDLFKAVTAIREDSDQWQYFTNGVKFILFDDNDFNEFYIKMNYYRKATLSELKELFKRA